MTIDEAYKLLTSVHVQLKLTVAEHAQLKEALDVLLKGSPVVKENVITVKPQTSTYVGREVKKC